MNEHAVGTKGISNVGGNSIKPTTGDSWRYRSEKQVDPYQQEHDDLFAAIRKNTDYNEAFNGAKSTLTSIMGRYATYSGLEIGWDQALNSELNLFPDKLAWDAEPKSLPNAEGFYKIAMPGQWKLS